jgi:hypothetical protein
MLWAILVLTLAAIFYSYLSESHGRERELDRIQRRLAQKEQEKQVDVDD